MLDKNALQYLIPSNQIKILCQYLSLLLSLDGETSMLMFMLVFIFFYPLPAVFNDGPLMEPKSQKDL